MLHSIIRLFTGEDSSKANKFSHNFLSHTKSTYACTVPSARAGLYMLLDALDIGVGDEVLVTGLTCSAVPEPILFRGAKPVYVDVDKYTFSMIPESAAQAITTKTKAIIVQHTFGLPAFIEELNLLAKKNNLFVIEDCALALGSKTDRSWLGTFGDASIFSFELSKTITAGWGGLIQVNFNQKLANKINHIRNHAGHLNRFSASRKLFQAGLSGILYHPVLFSFSGKFISLLFKLGIFSASATKGDGINIPSNYLAAPADAQWGILSNQLDAIDKIIAIRKYASSHYQEVLDKHGYGGSIPIHQSGVVVIRFPILINNRERFIREFDKEGIEVGSWFNQTVSCDGGDTSLFGYEVGSCPNAEFIAKHIVNLPVHSRVGKDKIALIAKLLDQYLTKYPDEHKFFATIRD